VNGGSVTGTAANRDSQGPVGIAGSDGATLNVTGTSSSGNTNICTSPSPNASCSLAQPGAGIALDPSMHTGSGPAAANLNGSTSGDDIGVLVAGGGTGPSENVSFTGGTYGGNSEGVVVKATNNGSSGGVDVTMTGTSVSGTATGEGLVLQGGLQDIGQAAGGTTPADTNTFSNNAVGVVLGAGGILNNASVNSNIAFGVLNDGSDAPQEFQPTPGAVGNQVTNVAFSANGASASEVNGANVADFSGYSGPTGFGAGCSLHTTSTIAAGSGAPSSLALKNTGGSNCTVTNGEPIVIPGLAVTVWVNNGAGISHVLTPGTTFTFSVAPVQVLSLTPDPTNAIPSGTAVSAGPASDTGNSGIVFLSGNSTDITGDSCSTLGNTGNTLFNNVTNPGLQATGNGGYFDC
jgi:hypothetical protein